MAAPRNPQTSWSRRHFTAYDDHARPPPAEPVPVPHAQPASLTPPVAPPPPARPAHCRPPGLGEPARRGGRPRGRLLRGLRRRGGLGRDGRRPRWSYGAIAWRALTGRRTSGLLVLAALLLTGRTLLLVLADSTWLYFLQPVISDGAVAALFLLSLASARPMVARLAGDFYPMDHDLASRPRIQRLFRNLTIMWAVLGLAKATATLWLLEFAVARDLHPGEEHLDAGHQRAGGLRDDRPRRPRRAPGGPDGPGRASLCPSPPDGVTLARLTPGGSRCP